MKTASILLLASIVSGACSRATESEAPGEIAPTGSIQYDGQFRNTQQSDGNLRMSSVFQANGSVRVIFREATGRSVVTLNLSTSSSTSEVLTWAIVPGRCGSGSMPLAPAAQFPVLEFSNSGRAELTNVSISVALPAASYHVDVFRGGESLSNVVACANLTRRG